MVINTDNQISAGNQGLVPAIPVTYGTESVTPYGKPDRSTIGRKHGSDFLENVKLIGRGAFWSAGLTGLLALVTGAVSVASPIGLLALGVTALTGAVGVKNLIQGSNTPNWPEQPKPAFAYATVNAR